MMIIRPAVLILSLLGCRKSEPTQPPLPVALAVTPVVSGLSSPVFLTAPANDARLFVLEQPGRIRIVENGTLVTAPFLDIASQVSSGGERGLLGMAFHPQYATNGFFYVNFTDTEGDTRVVRYTVSGTNRNVANAASGKLIIRIDQPFANHNGGMIAFGPDGMLYIGMGDGGSGGDPQNHAQTRSDLLGDMLRLNVDVGDPYTPAAGNPYLSTPSVQPEIWAYGLRNPWRFSFDRSGGDLYIADVGQGSREEINVVPHTRAGVNYGWKLMEGSQCFVASCSQTGLTLPVLDYDHSGGACSVTGGYVYRGAAIPGIVGHYFYSDYCAGWLRSFRHVDGQATQQTDWQLDLGNVLSFGEDAAGELYILTANGQVLRLVEAS
jgi:glucose/arabinose dehydrogenase